MEPNLQTKNGSCLGTNYFATALQHEIHSSGDLSAIAGSSAKGRIFVESFIEDSISEDGEIVVNESWYYKGGSECAKSGLFGRKDCFKVLKDYHIGTNPWPSDVEFSVEDLSEVIKSKKKVKHMSDISQGSACHSKYKLTFKNVN